MRIGFIENTSTGSRIEYDAENPPVYPISYVKIENGQLVFVHVSLGDLPDLVREFVSGIRA